MVKATPTSTFVMAQAEFTFELFVITFDAPAQFGIIDECGEGRVLGQGRKPVFCGSRLSLRPFDEQPFDRMRCGSLVVPRGEVHANGGEAGSKRRVRSVPPRNAAPCLFDQAQSQVFDRDRLVFVVALRVARAPAAATPRLGRQRCLTWRPHAGRRLDADDIEQVQSTDTGTEVTVCTIARIGQDDTGGDTLRLDLAARVASPAARRDGNLWAIS